MGWSGREWRDGGKVYYLNVSFCVVGRFGRECRAPNIRHFHHHVYQHHFSVIIIMTISIIIILHDYQVINRHADHQHYDRPDKIITISSSGWSASIQCTIYREELPPAGREWRGLV